MRSGAVCVSSVMGASRGRCAVCPPGSPGRGAASYSRQPDASPRAPPACLPRKKRPLGWCGMHGARLRFPLLVLVAGVLAVTVWTLLGGNDRPGGAPRAATDMLQHESPSFADSSVPAPAPPDAVVQPLLPESAAADFELRL